MFDPELLKPIIGELAKQARPLARDSRLKDLQQLLTLVDGTLLIRRGGPRMAEASWLKRPTGNEFTRSINHLGERPTGWNAVARSRRNHRRPWWAVRARGLRAAPRREKFLAA